MNRVGRPSKRRALVAVESAAPSHWETSATDELDGSDLTHESSAADEADREFATIVGELRGIQKLKSAVVELVFVTDFVRLSEIKKSKVYRGKKVISARTQKLVTITTWEEFCVHALGRSAEAVDLDLANRTRLGEGFVDAMQNMGIGPGRLREIRKLPDDLRSEILEAAKTGDPDTVGEVVKALIAKHERERQDDKDERKKIENELNGARKLLTARNDDLRELEFELEAARTFKPKMDSLARTRDEAKALEVLENGRQQMEPMLIRFFNAAADLQRGTNELLHEHGLQMSSYMVMLVRKIIRDLDLDVATDNESFGLPEEAAQKN